MTNVEIRELKARLSTYLAQVRAGDEVIVRDGGRPIARLIRIDPNAEELHELARRGGVRIGSGTLPSDFWTRERPADPDASVRKALLEERRG